MEDADIIIIISLLDLVKSLAFIFNQKRRVKNWRILLKKIIITIIKKSPLQTKKSRQTKKKMQEIGMSFKI